MAFQYENRRGETYYLQMGKTRTGKPNYYMGRKLKGTALARTIASMRSGGMLLETPSRSTEGHSREDRLPHQSAADIRANDRR